MRVRWATEGFVLRLIHIFVDDVMRSEYALVNQGVSIGGLVWWSDVCNLKNVCLLWAVTVFR
jgi:hypothetical protein